MRAVPLLIFAASVMTFAKAPEPKLPIVEEQSCLAKGRSNWPIARPSTIYSSWQAQRTELGRLVAGEKVTVLRGITITLQPDRLLVTKTKPDIGLQPGDIILRYEILGEGNANIWARGVWYNGYDLWTATETDGTGCRTKDTCDSKS